MNSNQCLPRNSVKSHAQGLTHKPIYESVVPYGMKNETKRTLRNAALALLGLAVLALLGWLETQAGLPNH